jgi:hypothetical protein
MALSAIPLAQLAWQGSYLSMGNLHETESRWWGVGEVVLWVVFYFSAVWIFNALLPPKPEQTRSKRIWGNKSGNKPTAVPPIIETSSLMTAPSTSTTVASSTGTSSGLLPANILLVGIGFFIDSFSAPAQEDVLWLHRYGNIFEVTLASGQSLLPSALVHEAWLRLGNASFLKAEGLRHRSSTTNRMAG